MRQRERPVAMTIGNPIFSAAQRPSQERCSRMIPSRSESDPISLDTELA